MIPSKKFGNELRAWPTKAITGDSGRWFIISTNIKCMWSTDNRDPDNSDVVLDRKNMQIQQKIHVIIKKKTCPAKFRAIVKTKRPSPNFERHPYVLFILICFT